MSSPALHRHLALSLSHRRAIQTSRLSPIRPVPAACARPFSMASPSSKQLSTDESVKTGKMPEDKHATDKAKEGDTLDVQSESVSKGMSSKATGTGGHATEQRDSAGGKERAKRDHPEAPDPAIGMQDERGGKGGR